MNYKTLSRAAIIILAVLVSACARLSAPVFTSTPEELAELLKPKGKPLIINHWATWCAPCVAELPYLSSIAKQYSGKIDFTGVAWDNLNNDKPNESIIARVNQVREKTGATFYTIIAPSDISEMAQKLKLLSEAVPQTFVISKSGERSWSFSGEIIEDSDKAAFIKAIETALKE